MIFRNFAVHCLAVTFELTGTMAKAHDLSPFLNVPGTVVWEGGGTATIDGQIKSLDVFSVFKPEFEPGNVVTGKVGVSTQLKLDGFTDKNFEYTMLFNDKDNFSILVKDQIIGAGKCVAKQEYDVTCDFAIPAVHHSEVFHFYRNQDQQGNSCLFISAHGSTDLWGHTARFDYMVAGE